jgi:cytochrome c oxidase subunit 2
MTRTPRPRRLATALLTGAIALALAACSATSSTEYPNSTFNHHTEFNTAIDALWDRLLFLGTIVFVIVEAALIYVVVRYRRRPGQAEPKHVHGNTTLEILWTAIPAIVLIFIAVPTVRTIFRTQAKAVPNALQVEVIGHQWWWEFRYPQYNITTANELYIPVGRTVNFSLKTADVLHSFWIPQMGGKRDLIANHTNFLWFTPVETLETSVWNGHCAEYCGASHANMKFRTYTVQPAEFDSWVAGQQQPAAFGAVASPAQTSGPATAGAAAAAAATAMQAGVRDSQALGPDANARNVAAQPISPSGQLTAEPQDTARSTSGGPAVAGAAAGTGAGALAPGYVFPREKLPKHVIPSTPLPAGLGYDDALVGDAARGQQAFVSCIGCHYINGNPMARGVIGPNLTHIGSRHTIAGGLYPNDAKHLARWIKNSRAMKPGSLMPTLGLAQRDPVTKAVVTKRTGGLTDQQIADIVAYLQALK